MPYATAKIQLLLATMQRSDIEYRLLMISKHQEVLARRSTDIAEKKINILKDYYANCNQDEDIVFHNASLVVPQYLDFDKDIARINAIEKVLMTEKTELELRHKTMTALEDSMQKHLNEAAKSFKFGD